MQFDENTGSVNKYLNQKCDKCDVECEHKDLDELILVSDIKNPCAKCDFKGSNLQYLTKHIIIDHNKRKLS